MDGITRREIAAGEGHIDVERKIKDGERADRVKGPCPKPFHGPTLRAWAQRARCRDKLSRGRNLWRDIDGELAVAVGERGGVDLLELDLSAHHPLLPGVVLGV